MTLCMPTLNWVVENQPIVTGILTQPSSRKQFTSRRNMSLNKIVYVFLFVRVIENLFLDYESILSYLLCKWMSK